MIYKATSYGYAGYLRGVQMVCGCGVDLFVFRPHLDTVHNRRNWRKHGIIVG